MAAKPYFCCANSLYFLSPPLRYLSLQPYLLTNNRFRLLKFHSLYSKRVERLKHFEDRNIHAVNNSLFYRAGFEYQHEVGRRWKMNVGVDYIGSTTRFVNSFSNGFEVVTSENASITHGVGPTLSFQYYISPRISLFTRSGIFYSITNGIAQTTFSVNSQNNTKTTTTSNEMEFTFPSSIFVAIQL